MQLQEIKTHWRNAVVALAAVFVVVGIAFFDTLTTLIMTWWDKPEYNHCLLIVPIIVYLIHERRDVFQRVAPEPCWLGVIPLLAGALVWLLGELADANVVRQFGLIILIQGCFLTILGKRVIRAFIFPIFYMIFLIPFGDFLVPMLQDYTTWFVIVTLNLFNIPVFVEGVYISIPAGDFHVAEACAGLRFLVATVALGTLMANVAYKTPGRQATVVILSFIVPVIANGFRASGIILIAHWSDMKYATGVDHITFGWIFFALVLLIFISIAMTFTNRGLNDGYIDFSRKYWTDNAVVPVKKFLLYSIIGVIFTGFAPYYMSVIEQNYQNFEPYAVNLEESTWGQDVADKTGWKPFYEGASQAFHLRQDNGRTEPVDVYVAYYKYQTKGIEMIRHGNGVVPKEIWGRIKTRKVSADISGLEITVTEEQILSRGQKRLVWYWYWVDGELTANKYKAKLFDARAKLTGGRLDSAIVAISVPLADDDIDQKRQILSRFAAGLPRFNTIVSR